MSSEIWAGQVIEKHGRSILPFSRVYRLTAPGHTVGFVWNRPVSVQVTGEDGSRQIIPIVDLTRRLQVVILLWGTLAALLILLVNRRK